LTELTSNQTRAVSKPSVASDALLHGWLVVALYAIVRLVIVPGTDLTVFGLDHDSAYIIQAAENLRAGRGLVLDTHWLVFLHPAELPMPLHNANPLMALSVASMATIAGGDVVRAGFMVSGLAHAILLAALFWWTGFYTCSVLIRILVAAGGAFFPPVFLSSVLVLPDLLCAALTAWSLGLLLEKTTVRSAIGSGIFFGMAWLARSSVTLLLPALLVMTAVRLGWGRALTRLTLVGLAALVVAAPWLVHTSKVWGSPTRSDAGFYLMQDYHARQFGGSVLRYWHSTELPRSPGEVLRHEPLDLMGWTLVRLPEAAYRALTQVSGTGFRWIDRAGAYLLLVAFPGTLWILFVYWRLDPHRVARLQPLIFGLLLFTAVAISVFAIRAESFQLRYLILAALGFAALLTGSGIAAAIDWRRRRNVFSLAHCVISLMLWVAWLAVTNALLWRHSSAVNPEIARYESLAKTIAEQIGVDRPVVTGTIPYYFTLITGAQSLSIPESDDAYLVEYMKRYGARHVLLTREEMMFWRPQWNRETGPPAPLRRISQVSADHILVELDEERKSP
jgi:4-amino-4-deoxy-L-arabinose transferase-like glycosyltransferase